MLTQRRSTGIHAQPETLPTERQGLPAKSCTKESLQASLPQSPAQEHRRKVPSQNLRICSLPLYSNRVFSERLSSPPFPDWNSNLCLVLQLRCQLSLLKSDQGKLPQRGTLRIPGRTQEPGGIRVGREPLNLRREQHGRGPKELTWKADADGGRLRLHTVQKRVEDKH